MVLSKLRILNPADEAAESQRPPVEGGLSTFGDLLEYTRKTWGRKVAFQEKQRREWRRYSYEDVYERSHALAAGLVSLGLQRGDRVVMVLENGYDWVTAYYGIVLAGGIGVPIYYDLKTNEIHDMMAHADPAMVVVSAKTAPKVDLHGIRVKALIVAGDAPQNDETAPSLLRRSRNDTYSLDEVAGRATREARDEAAARRVEPDDLASIVFTSGTSGGNKGVMLTHRNFMANLQQVRSSIPFNERDRLVIVLPLHHAFPFIVTLAVAPVIGGEVTFENDLRRIRDRMAEVKPTLFLGVPALFEIMYRNIVHSIETQGRLETFQKGLRIVEATKKRTGINIGRIVFRELHKRLGGSMRFMVSGGAALNPDVARKFAMLGVPILQGWGLSEAAPVLSAQRWNPRKFYTTNYYEEHFGSIGEPLEGVDIALIDVPEKELYVHLHGEGEIIARGDNISPGYWRAEEATNGMKLGEWLRTGDVGRIDDEGNIWITGRSKFVIVLDSGEKVHPDEVEEKLERSPAIEDIVVMGRKMRGKTQIVALVYPNYDGVLARLNGDLTDAAVLEIVEHEIDEQELDVAAYKRVVEVMLTDEPLPRTAIRKVMRGHIADHYSFDIKKWQQSWAELMAETSTVGATQDSESEEALATA